jgi:hypothetical protein
VLDEAACRTERELLKVCTAEKSRESLLAQVRGLPKKRGSAAPIMPCTSNGTGCWLASGKGKKSGHVGMAPIFPRRAGRGKNGEGRRTVKRCGQLVHRLAVRAFGSEESIINMLGPNRWDVSHLCHRARCFRPSHLVVKSHWRNLLRRDKCETRGKCCCGLAPRCIF